MSFRRHFGPSQFYNVYRCPLAVERMVGRGNAMVRLHWDVATGMVPGGFHGFRKDSMQPIAVESLASPSVDVEKTLSPPCTNMEPTPPQSTVGAAVHETSASPTHDVDFTVDIGRSYPGQPVGLNIEQRPDEGLRVGHISPKSVMADWNECCRNWFPTDEVRSGDMILRVNDVGVETSGGLQLMVEELKTAMDLLLLVSRRTSSNVVADV